MIHKNLLPPFWTLRQREQDPRKKWHLSTEVQSITSQMPPILIFTAIRLSTIRGLTLRCIIQKRHKQMNWKRCGKKWAWLHLPGGTEEIHQGNLSQDSWCPDEDLNQAWVTSLTAVPTWFVYTWWNRENEACKIYIMNERTSRINTSRFINCTKLRECVRNTTHTNSASGLCTSDTRLVAWQHLIQTGWHDSSSHTSHALKDLTASQA
jgi:hypothetical protein